MQCFDARSKMTISFKVLFEEFIFSTEHFRAKIVCLCG